MPLPDARLRPEALAPPESGIVEVFNYGRGRQGLIPLWVGEGDLPTPAFVREAGQASIAAGDTFYTWQRGLPDLREAIAVYMSAHYGAPYRGAAGFDPERFFLTVGGMHALQIAIRMTCGAGDEVLIPTPAWPNFAGAILATGARPVETPLVLADTMGGPQWRADLDAMEAAITPATRVIVVNTPGNPTGWMASLEELQRILDIARRHGLWIVADEIYGRIVYDGDRAPSFHDIAEDDDAIFYVQTFSKNWAMTGWRIGWLEAPQRFGPTIENLIQYSTSGVPLFVQRAALAAITQGEDFFAAQLKRIEASRDILCEGLGAIERIRFARPLGAFYLFFQIAGIADTRKLALQLVDEANVGLAPGTAFGAGGAPFLRLCFARDPLHVADATQRLVRWLKG